MSSATRLLVLGVLRASGQAQGHGYQVRQALLSWAADRWANVRPGSIYHALRKLAADGLVEPVDAEESALGPERTVYRITHAGVGEFFMLLNKAVVEGKATEFNAALVFLPTLGRKDAMHLLTTRLRGIEGDLATQRHLRDTNDAMGKPPHVRELVEYWIHLLDGELTWLRAFVAKIEAGEYTFADDSPDAFGSPTPAS